jgi:hypothetical protein
MTSRPPVRPRPPQRPAPPPPPEQGFWARWWASPVNKARLLAPVVILILYFLFLRD